MMRPFFRVDYIHWFTFLNVRRVRKSDNERLKQTRYDLAQYAHKIGHIQFADCPGLVQSGTGQINFEPIFLSIEKLDYSGWIGAEYKPGEATKEKV
jgi:sugar phosphate isomerase/epimerase